MVRPRGSQTRLPTIVACLEALGGAKEFLTCTTGTFGAVVEASKEGVAMAHTWFCMCASAIERERIFQDEGRIACKSAIWSCVRTVQCVAGGQSVRWACRLPPVTCFSTCLRPVTLVREEWRRCFVSEKPRCESGPREICERRETVCWKP